MHYGQLTSVKYTLDWSPAKDMSHIDNHLQQWKGHEELQHACFRNVG